tara:strand:- start:3630 stop:4361 length:732 start_codon:yes stop_codon:yes gene_type:complete
MKLILIIFGVCLSFLSIGQDTNNFYLNSVHLEYSFSGRVSRSTTLPNQVKDNGFYQYYFGEYGVPDRVINNRYVSNQFGVNFGFIFDSYSKKKNRELLIGFGYQNSGEYTDRLTRNNYPKDSTNYTKNLAEITIDQKYREIYLNGAWLFKTKGKKISFHSGLGFNFAIANPDYLVSEFENGIQINQYNVRDGIKTYTNFYIPIGFEVKRNKKRGKGFVFGFDYSVRFLTHIYSSFSISLGYKY